MPDPHKSPWGARGAGAADKLVGLPTTPGNQTVHPVVGSRGLRRSGVFGTHQRRDGARSKRIPPVMPDRGRGAPRGGQMGRQIGEINHAP